MTPRSRVTDEWEKAVTPVSKNPCPWCGVEGMIRVSDLFPPPATKAEARKEWPGLCVSTQARRWEWCPRADRLVS